MDVESQSIWDFLWFKMVTLGGLGPNVFELGLVFGSITD